MTWSRHPIACLLFLLYGLLFGGCEPSRPKGAVELSTLDIRDGHEWTNQVALNLRTSMWWTHGVAERDAKERLANPFFVSRSSQRPPAGTNERLSLWWYGVPDRVKSSHVSTSVHSNIHPTDYVGAEACGECHEENYQLWSEHPHRWMNTEASDLSVKGDFSGQASVSYLGGRGTFYMEDGEYRMRLERGDVRRVYHVRQTIGSRFYQYYSGIQLEGPLSDPFFPIDRVEHVLPFGYWIDEKEWVPITHLTNEEMPDGQEADPYDSPDSNLAFAPYFLCNHCHTTFPYGDQFIRHSKAQGQHTPVRVHWNASSYLESVRPELLSRPEVGKYSERDVGQLFARMEQMDARRYATSLGVTCEACHFGGRAHASGQLEKPSFLPSSPHLYLHSGDRKLEPGRAHTNVNWICGRCHAGGRPEFAAGMSTWNSIEYTDAMRGACYSELQCVHCHNPHKKTGRKWAKTPAEDDALCLKCHDKQFGSLQAIQAHTHHQVGSPGSRCMNCHMPRLNEGLQDMVRTHMIFSPTHKDMIEQNHPNACNMCHTNKTIDWTLGYLKQWYGATYSETKLAETYPNRDDPAAVGWVLSRHSPVRLVGADSLMRARSRWAVPFVILSLNDPYLVNRQFTGRFLEQMLGINLEDHGYRFYMTPEERAPAIRRLHRLYAPLGRHAAAMTEPFLPKVAPASH